MLRAGTARADITPDPAMLNWVNQEPYDGILDPIHVRALALSDGKTRLLCLCWDLIDASDRAVEHVRDAVHQTTGIPGDHVLVAASHTHSAPRSVCADTPDAPGLSDRERASLRDPVFMRWAERLPGVCAQVAGEAQATMQEVRLSIGRADVGEWLYNRRPIDADGRVVTMFRPRDPCSLPDGLRFRMLDPTLTALSFRSAPDRPVATLFSAPCHAVSIYNEHKGVSADWPGLCCERIATVLRGEALFLQGCAGDIVPAQRGVEARGQMARTIADRTVAAVAQAHLLSGDSLVVASRSVPLPLTSDAAEAEGCDARLAELQGFAHGPLALVALPGEPLNALAREVQSRSPFPHTLVIGYANGRGVGYVGLPGEKARGGYEARAGRGTEECGLFLVETALHLLGEMRDR